MKQYKIEFAEVYDGMAIAKTHDELYRTALVAFERLMFEVSILPHVTVRYDELSERYEVETKHARNIVRFTKYDEWQQLFEQDGRSVMVRIIAA